MPNQEQQNPPKLTFDKIRPDHKAETEEWRWDSTTNEILITFGRHNNVLTKSFKPDDLIRKVRLMVEKRLKIVSIERET